MGWTEVSFSLKQEGNTGYLDDERVDLNHLGCGIPLTQFGAKTLSCFGIHSPRSCMLYKFLPPKLVSYPSLLSHEKSLPALSSHPVCPSGTHFWVPGDQMNPLQECVTGRVHCTGTCPWAFPGGLLWWLTHRTGPAGLPLLPPRVDPEAASTLSGPSLACCPGAGPGPAGLRGALACCVRCSMGFAWTTPSHVQPQMRAKSLKLNEILWLPKVLTHDSHAFLCVCFVSCLFSFSRWLSRLLTRRSWEDWLHKWPVTMGTWLSRARWLQPRRNQRRSATLSPCFIKEPTHAGAHSRGGGGILHSLAPLRKTPAP